MQDAQQFDGVEEIRSNGDIVLTKEAHENFKTLLGIDSRVVSLEDSYDQAMELRAKFAEFARKNGVTIPK
jgi:hypothetical protein